MVQHRFEAVWDDETKRIEVTENGVPIGGTFVNEFPLHSLLAAALYTPSDPLEAPQYSAEAVIRMVSDAWEKMYDIGNARILTIIEVLMEKERLGGTPIGSLVKNAFVEMERYLSEIVSAYVPEATADTVKAIREQAAAEKQAAKAEESSLKRARTKASLQNEINQLQMHLQELTDREQADALRRTLLGRIENTNSLSALTRIANVIDAR